MSTRQAPYQHADGSNCWTKNCSRGHVSATATAPADAIEEFRTGGATVITPDTITQRLQVELVRPGNADLDFDSIANELNWVREWEEPWTAADRANLTAVRKIVRLTGNDQFTATDEAKVRALIADMTPAVERPRKRGRYGEIIYDGSKESEGWRARDKMLNSLAKNLLTRRLADELPVVEASGIDNEHLLGLQAAQEAALRNVNRPHYYKERGTSNMGAVEEHLQSAIARTVAGEEVSPIVAEADHTSLLPERERMFAALHESVNGEYSPQLYLAAVFPVRELKAEMDRAGIGNVFVTPFYNTREWGNAYTVMTPSGGTRTFSVYEHRNTDSIIINGTENWDGKDLPYAADSKEAFFAEFGPDDHVRAAQALTFYLMQAQDGDLASDEQLVSQVSRRDWADILDRSIPGFKDWRQSHVSDTYIAPAQENDADILKRLDF